MHRAASNAGNSLLERQPSPCPCKASFRAPADSVALFSVTPESSHRLQKVSFELFPEIIVTNSLGSLSGTAGPLPGEQKGHPRG